MIKNIYISTFFGKTCDDFQDPSSNLHQMYHDPIIPFGYLHIFKRDVSIFSNYTDLLCCLVVLLIYSFCSPCQEFLSRCFAWWTPTHISHQDRAGNGFLPTITAHGAVIVPQPVTALAFITFSCNHFCGCLSSLRDRLLSSDAELYLVSSQHLIESWIKWNCWYLTIW